MMHFKVEFICRAPSDWNEARCAAWVSKLLTPLEQGSVKVELLGDYIVDPIQKCVTDAFGNLVQDDFATVSAAIHFVLDRYVEVGK